MNKYSVLLLFLIIPQTIYWVAVTSGMHPFLAINLTGLIFSAMMTYAEYARDKKFPPWEWSDIYFVIFVQILMVQTLEVSSAFYVQFNSSSPLLTFLRGLWPHQLHPVLQLALMFVISEFTHYWLHRKLHENRWLWKLHAVHHSSEELHWLNANRSHPIDKFLQLVFDTLIYIFLGVDMSLVYSNYINHASLSCLQHAKYNIDYGWMNRILGTRQLHSWHHSSKPQEADTNYGNKLSIFDQIFGTYFRPTEEKPLSYGLDTPHYPVHSFAKLLLVPFRRNRK